MIAPIPIVEDDSFLDLANDAITAETAARLRRVPLADIQRLIEKRTLPSRLIGSRIYVHRADVLALPTDRREANAECVR